MSFTGYHGGGGVMTTAAIARANDALGTLLEVQREMIPLAALLKAMTPEEHPEKILALVAGRTCTRLAQLALASGGDLETHINDASAVCAAVNAAALMWHTNPADEEVWHMHLPSNEYIAAVYRVLEQLVQRYASDDVIGQVVDRIAGEEA